MHVCSITDHDFGLRSRTSHACVHHTRQVVFDPAPITAGLPTSIEAFFFQPGSSWQDRERVRNAWQAFKRRYRGATTPLLQYDPAQGSRDSHDAFSQFG